MRIRPIVQEDSKNWVRMRCELWPGVDAEHTRNVRRYFEGTLREPCAVLIAEDDSEIAGFAELSIRAYAEGCDTEHVGYVEGWYVVPDARGRGVGRALIEASEAWAREQGCTELASDAELDNIASDRAHKACGFTETGQIRCYRKML